MPSVLLLASALASAMAPAAGADVWSYHRDHVLGTSFDMTVAGASQAEARFAYAAALAEIDRLDRVLSAWRDDSELAALNRSGQAQRVSPDLFAVIAACEAWRDRTDGAFSARLGAVEGAWRTAGDHAPDPDALCAVAGRAGAARVGLDHANLTIARPADVRFAPDGLAKGYVIDAALSAARRAAPCAGGMMIDIGGDVACWGARDWRVGVADPAQAADNAAPITVARLTNAALAVSGPGMRDHAIGGAAYSHLLDAATGQPAPRLQAAVIAPYAVTADALTTALAVMPRDRGLALAEAMPGVEALLLEGGESVATTGWAACQAGAPLPAAFQVEVSYELPKIEAAKYRKPYVLVWVTDLEKNPIKTLAMLGQKQDWQEDNYIWWRRYGRKQPGIVDTLAKPTRPPGRYTIGWDGTDEAGRRVAQGGYLIHIEAAREHGGHAYQTIEVNLGAAPVAGQAAGKDELGAARVRYGKKK